MGTRKETDERWPLGTYLREQRGKMSVREAARRAEVSESRWRQIELGYQQMSGGVNVPVHPRADTVATMCKAVAADVRKGLELAGHDPDHYLWLIGPALERMGPRTLQWFSGLPRKEREEVLQELQRLHVDTEVRQRGQATG